MHGKIVKLESVEEAFVGIAEAVGREWRNRQVSSNRDSDEFAIAKFQKGLWNQYQAAVSEMDFTACPTPWHRDILKLHVMAHVSFNDPDADRHFLKEFIEYVDLFLKSMDIYIRKAAEMLNQSEASMQYFYTRLIFHRRLLNSWPKDEESIKQVMYLKTMFSDDRGPDELGDWDKGKDKKGQYRYHFGDSSLTFSYLMGRVYRLANGALEEVYEDHFSSAQPASILLIEQIKKRLSEPKGSFCIRNAQKREALKRSHSCELNN